MLGVAVAFQGDYDRARDFFARSVVEGQAAHDRFAVALSLTLRVCPGVPGIGWPGEDLTYQPPGLPHLITMGEEAWHAAALDIEHAGSAR